MFKGRIDYLYLYMTGIYLINPKSMVTDILLIIVIIFLGGIIYTLKNGFNQIIKGLEVINKKTNDIKNQGEI
jgi:hypothetical protein